VSVIRDDQNAKGNGRALHARRGGLGDLCFHHHMKLVLSAEVYLRLGVLTKHLFETEIRKHQRSIFFAII
jgi:hypothetical protein